MAIDARLREGLQRSMSVVESDPESRLEETQRLGRRRVVVRRTASVAAIVAVVAIVALAAPSLIEVLRDQRTQPARPTTLAPIAGTYTVTITGRDAPRDPGAVGRWLLTLDRDGTLDLAPLTNGDLGRSVTQYQVIGDRFLTTTLSNASCSGLGRYTWSRSGPTLTFTVLSDPCALRVAILASRPWTTG